MAAHKESPRTKVIVVLEVGTIEVISASFTLGISNLISLAFNKLLSLELAIPITLTPNLFANLSISVNSSEFPEYEKIKSIAHTHSTYATVWAQSGKAIPLIGTTHADFWKNEIPLITFIKKKNIEKNYEKYTGKLILENLNKI